MTLLTIIWLDIPHTTLPKVIILVFITWLCHKLFIIWTNLICEHNAWFQHMTSDTVIIQHNLQILKNIYKWFLWHLGAKFSHISNFNVSTFYTNPKGTWRRPRKYILFCKLILLGHYVTLPWTGCQTLICSPPVDYWRWTSVSWVSSTPTAASDSHPPASSGGGPDRLWSRLRHSNHQNVLRTCHWSHPHLLSASPS